MDRALSEVTNGRSLQEVSFNQIGSFLTAVCKSSASATAYVLQVSWTAEDDSLTSSCTCPSFPKDKVCKHILGLLLHHAGSKIAAGNNITDSIQRSETTGDNPIQDTSSLPFQPRHASLPRATNPPSSTNLPFPAESSSQMVSGSNISLTAIGSFRKRKTPEWISQLASTQPVKALKGSKKAAVPGFKQTSPHVRPRAAAVEAAPSHTQVIPLREPLLDSVGNGQQGSITAKTHRSATNLHKEKKDQPALLLSSQPTDHDSHANCCTTAAEFSPTAGSRLAYLARVVDDASLLQACRLVQEAGTNATSAAAAANSSLDRAGGSVNAQNRHSAGAASRVQPDTIQREAGARESLAPSCTVSSKPGPVVHDLTEDVDVARSEFETGCLQASHHQTVQALHCALPSQPAGTAAKAATATGVATTQPSTSTVNHVHVNLLVKKLATARRSLAEIMEDSDDD